MRVRVKETSETGGRGDDCVSDNVDIQRQHTVDADWMKSNDTKHYRKVTEMMNLLNKCYNFDHTSFVCLSPLKDNYALIFC